MILSQFSIPQQFFGYDFYRNTMRYAIEKNLFDANLTQEHWGTDEFKFFAGNLYDVIPKLKERYTPTTKLQGDCKASLEGREFF